MSQEAYLKRRPQAAAHLSHYDPDGRPYDDGPMWEIWASACARWPSAVEATEAEAWAAAENRAEVCFRDSAARIQRQIDELPATRLRLEQELAKHLSRCHHVAYTPEGACEVCGVPRKETP